MDRVDVRHAQWRKSSYSNGNGNCVEAAFLGGHVMARDSKHEGSGPVLIVRAGTWSAFLSGVVDRVV
ncbi:MULTISPECIES: DUF397 domain-containing protein [Streptomyces]|uniref:DUF397 domain-containing protein n=1 Tax=Streptomyces TaxID=1883 RepID=UPI001906DD86|nr:MULTISPECIES: DUF397 domain-containing protein [unclassified Streptomyces]MCU4748906.1 DUF397 domain-containing protein [Streptomyces sp. G-5]QQN80345.1 DUF397 domain-containing protein [Streptomyces sp. XC 2026]